MFKRWFPTLVYLTGLAAALATIPNLEAPRFVLPTADMAQRDARQAAALPHLFDWADLPRPTPSAHAVSLAEVLPESSVASTAPVHLIAAWFGGSREGAPDVSLYQANRFGGEPWQSARVIMSRPQAEAELGRNIRKLGNPVIVSTGAGQLQLFFVSVSYGGWAGSAINQSLSTDGGQHWQPARRIVTSPFFNLSTLVRYPSVALQDQTLGLPVYHEFISKHGEWLRLSPAGQVLAKERMTMPRATLQPAVVPLSDQHAVAALRDAGPGDNQVQWSETYNAGKTWQAGSPRAIPNPNSAVAMIGLRDGTLLMACNPIPGNRNQLSLLRSTDQGSTWTLVRVIEESPDDLDEFSYPTLLQDHTGMIHLVYTWLRQGIRHVRFSQAWLNQPGAPTVPAVPQ